MKILFLSWAYPKKNTPYLGIWAHQQALALKAKGIEVDVINTVPYIPRILGFFSKKIRGYAHIPKEEQYDGIKVYHPRIFRSKPQAALDKLLFHLLSVQSKWIASMLGQWVDMKEYQIIHAHNLFPDGVTAYLLSKQFDIPYVITLHDVDKYNRFPDKGWQKIVSRHVIDQAKKVFVVSNRVKNNLLSEITEDRMQVLYNTFWTEEKPIVYPKDQNIVIIASLIERKGIHIMLQAFQRVSIRYNDYKLTIIGNGNELENLKRLVQKLNIEDKVVFTGTLAHREAMDQLSRASIFCLPSWDEAFGVVYAEAMSYGIPVIGCKEEGIADIISDRVNGMLVEAQNIDDLEQTLQLLIQDPEYAMRIGMEGKERIRELHPDIFAEKLMDIYREIVRVR